jgi:hypothetical protein
VSGHGVDPSTFTIRCRDTGFCSILYSRPTTDRRRPAGPAQTKPQIRQWIAASGSWCSKGDSRQAFPCGKIVRKWRATSGDSRWLFARCATVNNSSIKTQRDHGKRPSSHDCRQAISLRKMRLPLLPLVIQSKAQCVPDDVADSNNVLILVAPLE